MTSIRFLGDVPLWLGALAALAAATAVWFYYRREKHDLPAPLRIWLPLLRAGAVFLTVLILTGPVLHHRRVTGQLGRVLVFLDASQSMAVHDPQMPVARKLLVAEQQGLLPPGNVDATLSHAVDRLARVRRSLVEALQGDSIDVAALQGDSIDVAAISRCRGSLADVTAEIADSLHRFDWNLLASTAGHEMPWSDLPNRFRDELSQPAQTLGDQPIDQAGSRKTVIAQLLELADVAARFEIELLAAFDAYGTRLLASADQAITAAVKRCDQTNRWQRAGNSLLHPGTGLLRSLASTHDIQLVGLAGPAGEILWDRFASAEPPTHLDAAPTCTATDLGSPITARMANRVSSDLALPQPRTASRTAVVLLSDGRHNAGRSPVEAARILGGQQIPIYTVGFGARQEPPDLALLEVEHPDLVFKKDRIRGSLVIKDRMPAGQPFVAMIAVGDEVLWQEQLTTQDVPLRRIEFDFPIDELVERGSSGFDPGVKHHAIRLALRAALAPLQGETETSNNEVEFRFAAITQSYRVLLIDGRSRWETRYLRNVFQRDDQWQVDTVLAGPATERKTVPQGDGPDQFPADRGALFQYDLIVLGDIVSETLADSQWKWIRDFVELRGGGLIFIDAVQGNLRLEGEHPALPLLPVSRLNEPVESLPTRLQLTSRGAGTGALMLAQSPSDNQRLWSELPAPHTIVPVEALPDATTLVEAVVGQRVLPAMVTRTFGAGRVFYSAIDETWRWRYKVADTYHQRFWNQLAQWVMPRPFAVSDRYVSLDTGPPSYASGMTAEIRTQLRGVDGKPVTDATVDALLWQDGRIVSTVGLESDDTGSGVYRGRTARLTEGEYEVSVRASGFSVETLRARSGFVVQPPRNHEFEFTACNDDLLGEMADASGGKFLREEQMDELAQLLLPLSSGRLTESDTLLWQSYWWFAAIVSLLSIEWLLRKRAGLL